MVVCKLKDVESEKELESENEGISQDDITDFISKMTFLSTLSRSKMKKVTQSSLRN